MSPVFIFLIGYLVVALVCVGFGLYLSEPGHTWSTLKDDALNLLRHRSRSASVDPLAPVHYTPAQYDKHFEDMASVSAPTHDEIHARDVASAFFPEKAPASDEGHEEAAPVEVVHDEP